MVGSDVFGQKIDIIKTVGTVPDWENYIQNDPDGTILISVNSVYWCEPCIYLKKWIQAQTNWPSNVHFLLVDISYSPSSENHKMDYDELTHSPGYFMWRAKYKMYYWPFIFCWVVKNHKPLFIGNKVNYNEYFSIVEKFNGQIGDVDLIKRIISTTDSCYRNNTLRDSISNFLIKNPDIDLNGELLKEYMEPGRFPDMKCPMRNRRYKLDDIWSGAR